MDKKIIEAQTPPSPSQLIMDQAGKLVNFVKDAPQGKQDGKTGYNGVDQSLHDGLEQMGYDETAAYGSGSIVGLNIADVDKKIEELYTLTGATKEAVWKYLQSLVNVSTKTSSSFDAVYNVGLYLLSKYNADMELALSVLGVIADYAVKKPGAQLMSVASAAAGNPSYNYMPLLMMFGFDDPNNPTSLTPPTELMNAFSILSTPNAPLAAAFLEYARSRNRVKQTEESLESKFKLVLLPYLEDANKKTEGILNNIYNMFDDAKNTKGVQKLISLLAGLYTGAELKNTLSGATGFSKGTLETNTENASHIGRHHRASNSRLMRFVMAADPQYQFGPNQNMQNGFAPQGANPNNPNPNGQVPNGQVPNGQQPQQPQQPQNPYQNQLTGGGFDQLMNTPGFAQANKEFTQLYMEYNRADSIYKDRAAMVDNLMKTIQQQVGQTDANVNPLNGALDLSAGSGKGSGGMATPQEIEQRAAIVLQEVEKLKLTVKYKMTLFDKMSKIKNLNVMNLQGNGNTTQQYQQYQQNRQTPQTVMTAFEVWRNKIKAALSKENADVIGMEQEAIVLKEYAPIQKKINLMQLKVQKYRKNIENLQKDNANGVRKTQLYQWVQLYVSTLYEMMGLYQQAIQKFAAAIGKMQGRAYMQQFLQQKQAACYSAINDISQEIQSIMTQLVYQGFDQTGLAGVTMLASTKEKMTRMANIFEDEDNVVKSSIFNEEDKEPEKNEIYQEDNDMEKEADEKTRKYWNGLLPGFGDAMEYPQKNRNVPTRKIKFKRSK